MQAITTSTRAPGVTAANGQPGASANPAATASDLTTTVFTHLEPVAGIWRELEQRAVFTPYQRLDWVQSLWAARGGKGARLAVAVVSSQGRPAAILPLEVRRRFGVAVARIIGADIANAAWLPMEPSLAARLAPADIVALLAEVGRIVGGLDLLELFDQPASWGGIDNPLLAFPHQPAPDHLYLAALGSAEPHPHLHGKRARNIQRGRRRLEEEMGPVVLRAAATDAEIARVQEVFLRQRAERFARMGVPNVFAEGWFVDFFRRAAQRSLGEPVPALRLHALFAGDEIVATSFGTYTSTHYSQYINSTASGPAARFSLMGILMYDLATELAAGGITSLDMGLGDFDYKTDWAAPVEVFDGIVPVTAAGRLLTPALLGLRRLKRDIKRNQSLFSALKRVRALILRRQLPPPQRPETGAR